MPAQKRDSATRWSAQDWRVFGTGARLVVTDSATLAEAREAVDRELSAIDLAASRFRDDSELCRLNAACGRPTEVSELLAELLTVALEAAELTEGAVDPTLGVSLQKIGYDRTFRDVAAEGPPLRVTVRRQTDWRVVELDAAARTIHLPQGVELDLGATAKAHAADRAAAAAHQATGSGVLLSLGGDLAIAGPAPADGWPIVVAEDSGAPLDVPGPVIVVTAGGVATSSTTVRRWRRGDDVLHHLLDPWTGLPVTGHWRTATVAADSCLEANVAATAAVVLGTKAGRWLTRHGYPARLISQDGAVVVIAPWPADGS
jgi:thiamine biosynthesis lipoprotein ApbE